MCLGQIGTEEHVCAHLESLVEDECIRQVSVLEDDRVTALVALELGAVLLDEGLSVQNPTFLAILPECLQVVLVYLVALEHSVALVRVASLVGAMQGVAREALTMESCVVCSRLSLPWRPITRERRTSQAWPSSTSSYNSSRHI